MSPRARPSPAFLLAAVLAAALLGAACGEKSTAPTEYRIGAVLSLTGRGATYGEEARNGMQLAVDQLNAGPFKRAPLRLLVADSGSSAKQALAAFHQLIDADHVFVATGFLLSDEALACAPLANQRKVVLLSPFAASNDIKNAGDYVFRNRESASRQAEAIARAAVERFGRKRLAVLYSNAANGISYRDGFDDTVLRLKVPIPTAVSFQEGKADYRPEIEKLRAAAPDAVYLAGLDKELGLILKQAKAAGFAPQFFASAAAISPRLLAIAGDGAEGLVCGSAPFDPASTEPHVREFVTAYRERYGSLPGFLAANAYDAIEIVAGRLKAGATDGEALKSALYTVQDYPGVGGTTSFDPFGEVDKPITLLQVKNGAFRPLP
jgi:branched-chain amino acid transport system substrate-binding protein